MKPIDSMSYSELTSEIDRLSRKRFLFSWQKRRLTAMKEWRDQFLAWINRRANGAL